MKGICGYIKRGDIPHMFFFNRNGKFKEEKINSESSSFVFQLDGVLLNWEKPQKPEERLSQFVDLYKTEGERILRSIKGAFVFAFYDKEKKNLLISNDRMCKRSLYYYISDNMIAYAESYLDLLSLLSTGKNQMNVNVDALQAMVSCGAIDGTQTYVRQIKYLGAFESLIVYLNEWRADIISFYPEDTCIEKTPDTLIDSFDKAFSKAVELQFKKNKEYGYHQYIALSGGMDSRACLLQALKNGDSRDIICFNYSQSWSLDHRVSMQISIDHKLDYLHYPMDAAVFLKRLEESENCNECQQSGAGATAARTMAELLQDEKIGIIHTGLCGGELMGDLIQIGTRTQKTAALLRRLSLSKNGDCIFDRWKYFDNVRSCNNFSSMFREFGETISPFLDEDVVTLVLNIDPKLLFWRSFYRNWMQKYLPNDYETTFFYGPITISPYKELVKKSVALIKKGIVGTNDREMNPFEYWVKKQPELEKLLCDKYTIGINYLLHKRVPENIMTVIRNGWKQNWLKKLYVLTAINSVIDLINNKVNLIAFDEPNT
ncbi:MAG: 7-cyano-7-deazaguanine synthase [Clostridiales bacterium]|nr:7-cyano-7-deazaguanine synthase [Clostridiales bacterium]